MRTFCMALLGAFVAASNCSGQHFVVDGSALHLSDQASGAQVLYALNQSPTLQSRGSLLKYQPFLSKLPSGRQRVVMSAITRIENDANFSNSAELDRHFEELSRSLLSKAELDLADRERLSLAVQRWGVFALEDRTAQEILGMKHSTSLSQELKTMRMSLVQQISTDFSQTQLEVLDEVFSPVQFRRMYYVLNRSGAFDEQ